jgi:hypothetical protein
MSNVPETPNPTGAQDPPLGVGVQRQVSQTAAEVAPFSTHRHVIPISGKDSLCTALVQTTLHPEHDYTFMFSDVGMELPETYEWLDNIETALGIEIVRVGRSVREMIELWDFIPSRQRRYCTAKGKIKPAEDYLAATAEAPVTVYYGLRADEGERAGPITGPHTTAAFPLRRLGFGLRDVWKHLGRESERRGIDLLPPDYAWPALIEAVGSILGPDFSDLEPWQRRHLFAGRSRSNCFNCFFQRLYEWIWLLDTHPDHYDESQRLEQETGATRQAAFTWNSRWPLDQLRARRDELLAKRARVVASRIAEIRQGRMFAADDSDPMLAGVSCGLLCGK